MILGNHEIVWTPILGMNSLAIALDRNFAEACIRYKHSDLKNFTKAVWRFMGNFPPVTPSNFFDIHEGILPAGFYTGRDGVWLTLDTGSLSRPGRPLVYYAHSEDRLAVDRLWLLRAFGAWAEGSIAVMNWGSK